MDLNNPSNSDISIRYKCRLCDRVFNTGLLTKDALLVYRDIFLLSLSSDLRPSVAKLPPETTLHHCNDQTVGIADVIGASSLR